MDDLGRKLAASRSKEETRLRLMALGNAGSARSVAALAPYITHPSVLLRATAVAALRWMDAPPVDGWLTRRLLTDPDATVRQEAAGALGFREPTAATVAAQQRAFHAERVESIRLALLDNLGRAQAAFPALRTWLRDTAAGDASANVRKAAAALVAGSP